MYIISVGMWTIFFLSLVAIAFIYYKREKKEEVFIHKVGEGKFNVYLPRDTYLKLEELRNVTGKETLGETLRCALDWYKEHEGE